jgi:hypothetical protein
MSTSYYFISYANSDSEFAQKLAWDLKAKGIDTWLDTLNNKSGSEWDDARRAALMSAQGVVSIFSASALSSSEFLEEYAHTLLENVRMLPVLSEDCAVPSEVRKFQVSDCSQDYEAGLSTLVNYINEPYQAKRQALPLTPLSEREPTGPSHTQKLQRRWASAVTTSLASCVVFACLVYALYPSKSPESASINKVPDSSSTSMAQSSFQKNPLIAKAVRSTMPIAESAEYKARLSGAALAQVGTSETKAIEAPLVGKQDTIARALSAKNTEPEKRSDAIQAVKLKDTKDSVTCKAVKNMMPVGESATFNTRENVFFWAKLQVLSARKLNIQWQNIATGAIVKNRTVHVATSQEYRVFDQFRPGVSGDYKISLKHGAEVIKEAIVKVG